MKKIFNIVIFLITVIVMNACSLVNTDYTNPINIPENNETYIPVRIDFFERGLINDEETSDLFYWSWYCDLENPADNCSSPKYGKAFIVNNQSIKVETNETEEGTFTINRYIMDVNIFVSNDVSYLALYPRITLREIESQTNTYQMGYGFGFQNGITVKNTMEFQISETEKTYLEYSITIEEIDVLQNVFVKEYNNLNELITSTNITKDTDLQELVLGENTKYIIVEEVYLNNQNETYVERQLFEETTYYSLKFLENDGLVYNDYIILRFSE